MSDNTKIEYPLRHALDVLGQVSVRNDGYRCHQVTMALHMG